MFDEGMEFDEGSDIDNRENEQVFQDGVIERADGQEVEVVEAYGDDAYCEWCKEEDGVDVVGAVIGSDWCGDILLCPECGHEWLAQFGV